MLEKKNGMSATDRIVLCLWRNEKSVNATMTVLWPGVG